MIKVNRVSVKSTLPCCVLTLILVNNLGSFQLLLLAHTETGNTRQPPFETSILRMVTAERMLGMALLIGLLRGCQVQMSVSLNPPLVYRVCQQQGLSLWVPFQNAATAVTNLYKGNMEARQRSYDLGIHLGHQRRNKDVIAWVKKRRRTIRREDLISFLCGKVPPPRTARAPPRVSMVSASRPSPPETGSSVETDLQPFREAIALHGLSGAMASISVRSGPPGSPTHPAQPLSRRRNGLHDVDLNTFIAEEMALHLDSTANRKRGPAPCSDVITDSPTHKRNRML
uniref:Uncharacterized protein n=1 Tax=Gasterosteus aculeatus aculeatus TaxID=481459 RepID=A0AAQ4PGK6_GASAC